MMWNIGAREINGEAAAARAAQGDGIVAVAVDKDKSCQCALKWAIDNIFPRDKPIKLVHVSQTHRSFPSPYPGSSDTLNQQEADARANDLLLPYRCFCTRRQVQFEVVILNDQDVARALNDFVSHSGVEILLLGASSKNGLSRQLLYPSLKIFKNSDVPSSVMKTAPDFCSVYVISKQGKVSATRIASCSPPPISTVERTRPIQNEHADHNMSYDELSVAENENPSSHGGSGRLSTDSNCASFYESLGSGLAVDSSSIESQKFPSSQTVCSDALNEFSCFENPSFSLQNQQLEHMEDEMRRLKMELKQTMDKYDAACEEALTFKQKIKEFQDWKMKQEQRMKEVELAAMELVEKERAKCKEAIEATKRVAEQEMEKRVLKAEWTAHMEAEEKNEVWDALGHSHSLLKYQSSFHIFVLLFLFCIYFSLLK
ncbi:hypothetical protein L6164_006960 [Bauhinia variegata]|uniref:Uncharacterized protein n=1 Tax=Bauhinia variegata TaxID=167791 RepID=A0ACB9PV92_BAUVA|nr:hypothetical protein L6164_006960 [Bauhinia variegata]